MPQSIIHPEPTPYTPAPWSQIVTVPQGDRWMIRYRLEDLKIPCTCPKDGSLQVEVDHALALILVHSVLQRFTLLRPAAVDWLERCWTTPFTPTLAGTKVKGK